MAAAVVTAMPLAKAVVPFVPATTAPPTVAAVPTAVAALAFIAAAVVDILGFGW